MNEVISLTDVWKIYELGEVKIEALRGLSLTIHSGEFVAIMGPSGSGKSTALNMIGSLDVPSKGQVFLKGKDISTLTPSDLATLRGQTIGFIFQQFNLIPTLTALENVTLPMIFQGIDERKREKRGKELLEQVHLADRMHNKPTEMSGGQQQRVAIARALVNDPEVILADEPTGNLDSATGKSILDFLKQLHQQGKTIVMVTHDGDIGRKAQRIITIKDGKNAQ